MAKKFLSMDGNTAAAHVAYAFTEVASIYPITPSSPMAENAEAWSAQGKKNIFGSPVNVIEMQSEAGAAGAVHGALQGGALATTFTASQGLLLMIPNLYKIAGELLPGVFHVSARALATRALNIFGDHQDIYACRQVGMPMICSHSVQEVMDLGGIAHLTAIKSSVPVMHFFDGFRTSHEIQKVEVMDYDVLESLLDKEALARYKKNAMNPHTNPIERGGAENDDIYFQGREAQNKHYDAVVDVVADYMNKISEITGREYAPFTYYGAADASRVIVAMGSVTETIKETIDEMNRRGDCVGLIKVHLYRPFSAKYLLNVLPSTVEKVAVLDRTKEMGATGEPLYLDVVSVLKDVDHVKTIIGGRYGMGSKDTTPRQIKAVYDHLLEDDPFTSFTIGINDDVTHLSLKEDPTFHVDADYTACLFYGLGSDGTVSANKSSIKIIGDHTDLYSQAYFAYDSKKAGGATRSNLRFGNTPIRATYYVNNADFISCSLDNYVIKYDMLKNLKDAGTFLLNTEFSKEEIVDYLPNRVKKQLADKKAKFYIINANKIAGEIGMGRRTNTILQSAFFALNPQILPIDKAVEYMKEMAKKTYSKKGDAIVQLNYKAIDAGKDAIEEVAVDASWSDLTVTTTRSVTGDEHFDEFVSVINSLDGYDLPVSAFMDKLDGSMQSGIAIKEKRAIATEVPRWKKENCIQCNNCVMVCPHATIRAFLLDEEEMANLPENIGDDILVPMGKDMGGLVYRIQVSPDNCVGCGLCVTECPGKKGEKALEMVPVKEELKHAKLADYMYEHVSYKTDKYPLTTVKGVGFMRPYFEVSGACGGCGETPYYRLASQLFGKDMMIANATGCSSIYSGSTPSTPCNIDKDGQGPAWANSLFEDNAEFGFGMKLAENYKANHLLSVIDANKADCEPELKELLEEYIASKGNREQERTIVDKMLPLIIASKNEGIKELLGQEGDLVSKSQWIIGGDGWAYDIGYGGVDHVLASDQNVNILVLDTEVYSNTGGQSSKSSQAGSIAKFTAGGKTVAKKDLAQIAMAYGHVYVAQVAMGANPMQTIKAFKEAESYNGPSLIIAYSPCMEHGIKGGLSNHQKQQKDAVACGYFNLLRYDPRLEDAGKNPLQLDSKEPDFNKFKDFLLSENRFAQLSKINPEHVEELMEKCLADAKKRRARLDRML
ncbi:pyruvate-ferredoxin/flavodoxin oxidoreductase [Thomasclavelia cocleata]|uniref:Pyruvate-ferredoxin/flavodoxin oxidoreductase n=1 Tax=Thomasclavelia cocleata TaxID=69824 RepID=A0A1I0HPR9_9FIRM|nr:pyruvate:ferredoxin (flavodoxin) oxidoreductase [Thomasclavelia cocleata]MCR1961906.1 pyruvate:ferredoxin (flavodoxin) oxidoreductase [Thomasclavelia cocleata]NDO42295.1 pyruvate:ferredoxin (flavodoxin) oxidoreductase [Thomasclavelia cocleata]SET86080.1 pyruvate-ferredoxin/flavodoxin oxidoreductase [Thomasclavelia cocleata]